MDETTNGSVEPLYTDCNIPAKLFFEILNTKNWLLLGKGSESDLEEVFGKIFDEYTELDNNNKIKSWYSKNIKIRYISAQITQITNLLYLMMYGELNNDDYKKCIEVINAVPGVKCKFNSEKDKLEEVQRIQRVVLGSLRNSLKMLNENEEEKAEKILYVFQQDIARISSCLGFQINTDITMYEFVTYKQTASDRVKQQQNKK